MKFSTDIHNPQMVNPTDFGDSMTFSQVDKALGEISGLFELLNNCYEISRVHRGGILVTLVIP